MHISVCSTGEISTNFSDLLHLQKKGMVNSLPVLKRMHVDCEACSLGKLHKDELPVSVDRKHRNILKLVKTDLCGPMQTRSLGGAYYFLIFLMNVQDSPRCISSGRKVMLLNNSSNSKI